MVLGPHTLAGGISRHTTWRTLPAPLAAQVKEVPAAAAAWADEFDTQQRQQGPSMWGEEFAAFQAQQHPAATGEQWAADFEGEGGCPVGGVVVLVWLDGSSWARLAALPTQQFAAVPHCAAGATDWADQFAEGMLGGGAWAEEFADGRGSTGEAGRLGNDDLHACVCEARLLGHVRGCKLKEGISLLAHLQRR